MTEFQDDLPVPRDPFTEEAEAAPPEPLEIHSVRTKPIDGLAVKATTDNLGQIVDWINDEGFHAVLGEGQLTIQTLEGPSTVRPGDWAAYHKESGFSRCDGELFESTYDDLGKAV